MARLGELLPAGPRYADGQIRPAGAVVAVAVRVLGFGHTLGTPVESGL
jgi:hypothetical protein